MESEAEKLKGTLDLFGKMSVTSDYSLSDWNKIKEKVNEAKLEQENK